MLQSFGRIDISIWMRSHQVDFRSGTRAYGLFDRGCDGLSDGHFFDHRNHYRRCRSAGWTRHVGHEAVFGSFDGLAVGTKKMMMYSTGCAIESRRGRGCGRRRGWFALPQPSFFAKPFLVKVNATEAKTAKDHAAGTDVITDIAVVFWNKGCQRKAEYQGQAHCHLGETPSSGEIARSDLFVNVHFEAVVEASVENAINPCENDIATIGTSNGSDRENAEAGHYKAGLCEVLTSDATLGRLT